MTVNEIASTYPKTINSEQLRIILGISKRKCAWMLQNGVIPCKDTEKKTRRYTIEITDVIHYVNTVSENPYAYFIHIVNNIGDFYRVSPGFLLGILAGYYTVLEHPRALAFADSEDNSELLGVYRLGVG